MRIAILSDPPDLSAYVAEILKAWGLPLFETIAPDDLPKLDPEAVPVLVCPAPRGATRLSKGVVDYARRGGTVVAFLPDSELLEAAGLQDSGGKEGPLRLRVTDLPVPGLEGELLPVVGAAKNYEPEEGVSILAYLSPTNRFEGETVGITESDVGRGRLVVFAFDLPLCILLLRQGDPDRAEVIPEVDSCARPSHLAADIGPQDSGWVPFADQLALLFVGLLRGALAAPVPVLGHMPGASPGLLLFSGDEDNAQVEWTDNELDHLTSLGARMNLYIIPTSTLATQADVDRFGRNHDVGPHPNIRKLDGRPVAERVAEFARQIRMFQDMFGIKSRSYRNHCHAWAGYLEPADALEELGVRMDANYMCSNYARGRIRSPYLGFGAAMPMRYATPDGRIIDVVQQHTHLADDTMFSSEAVYSYKYSPRQFEVILRRTLGDIVSRFHTPYGVNIHPGNWVRFSRPQGEILLRQAAERDVPVWSWDQWSRFWDRRDAWRLDRLRWDGRELIFTAEGVEADPDLRLWLPLEYRNARLEQVTVNGDVIPWQPVDRHGQPVGLVPLSHGGTTSHFTITYT